MRRYLRLLAVQIRASVQIAMQYNVNFIFGGIMALFWMPLTLLPLGVVWERRQSIAGWALPEAVLVVGWFTLIKGVLEGAINPSLMQTVEHIRKGTLDFVLLKPADAQFLVSTTRFEPARMFNALGGFVLIGFGLYELGRTPRVTNILTALALTVASVAILYSLAIVVVSAAFWVVRLDNLIYLLNSLYDAARWPSSIFKGAWHIIFTFIIPLALMTTFPAEALLGRLALATGLGALGAAVAFTALARFLWTRAIGHYTSASS